MSKKHAPIPVLSSEIPPGLSSGQCPPPNDDTWWANFKDKSGRVFSDNAPTEQEARDGAMSCHKSAMAYENQLPPGTPLPAFQAGGWPRGIEHTPAAKALRDADEHLGGNADMMRGKDLWG